MSNIEYPNTGGYMARRAIGIAVMLIAIVSESIALQPTDQSFLEHAAEGQQAGIALGQLTLRKASHAEVKQFGEQMVQDSEKAKSELQELAAKTGTRLPAKPAVKFQQIQERLAQLSGNDFDRAYIRYMLLEHAQDVLEFERRTQRVNDHAIQQWALGTLRTLLGHLKRAQTVGSAIGSETTHRRP